MQSELPIDDADGEELAPLGGTRAQAIQRLQVGLSMLGGVILLVALANIIMDRAKQSEQTAVPEAASTVSPKATPTPAKDPLADAGVAPELPAEPAASPAPSPTARQGGNASAAQP